MARAALEETRRQHSSLRIVTGVPAVDVLLDDPLPSWAARSRTSVPPSAGSPG